MDTRHSKITAKTCLYLLLAYQRYWGGFLFFNTRNEERVNFNTRYHHIKSHIMSLSCYGENENPYVDLRLYPADNFLEVLHKYVRKNDAHERVSAAPK